MSDPARVTYVGHATVLIELDRVRILTDPVLRERIGPLRRRGAPPASTVAEDLDAVLISHLHHDHADLPSLRRLDRGVRAFVPSGAAGLLRRQGFTDVAELEAGDSVAVGGVRVSAVEARHAGGHRLGARATAALGFLVAGSQSVYFAGDTDLFDGMERLGDRLDLALLPVWGWGPNLGPGHLDPERAAKGAAALSPRIAVPIHWGTLYPLGLSRLAPGRLTEPPREFARWAERLSPQVEVRVLAPGEATSLS
ncbi:MAG TPA: MBL fold metallo-hydrolase [Solirubrobacterales bacterium]